MQKGRQLKFICKEILQQVFICLRPRTSYDVSFPYRQQAVLTQSALYINGKAVSGHFLQFANVCLHLGLSDARGRAIFTRVSEQKSVNQLPLTRFRYDVN
jgi:hypothetical protein